VFVPYGPHDQRERPEYFGCTTSLPLSSRHDVLVFQTPPLVQDVEVTGPLTVKLWVSSSAVDTDFAAKLIDVHPASVDYPDGYAMNLADGIIRARYRNGFERAELLEPDKVYAITFALFPTSNLFKAGHRIRVDLSSSNYPTYDPNPNTGDTYNVEGRGQVAENRIYHNADHPSHIVLPIIGT
jgi:putative CocE/NonD family hydrolase